MVQLEGFIFEEGHGEYHEHHEGYGFLDHLKLYQLERSSVRLVPDPVGGYLETIFEKGNAPTDQDNEKQSQVM